MKFNGFAKALFFCVFSFFISLASCATPYQSSGVRGGFKERQVDSNTFRVEFQGNGYTERITVNRYLLRRCAELTLRNGYEFFVVVGQDLISEADGISIPGQNVTSVDNSGNVRQTQYQSQYVDLTRYKGVAVIRCYHSPPQGAGAKALRAQDVLALLGE